MVARSKKRMDAYRMEGSRLQVQCDLQRRRFGHASAQMRVDT